MKEDTKNSLSKGDLDWRTLIQYGVFLFLFALSAVVCDLLIRLSVHHYKLTECIVVSIIAAFFVVKWFYNRK